MVNEVQKTSEFNTIKAAGATELLISKPEIGIHGWNRLVVTNRDANPHQIQLDGRTDEGYIHEAAPGGGFILEHTDGIIFHTVTIKNIGTVDSVADKVLVRASRVEL